MRAVWFNTNKEVDIKKTPLTNKTPSSTALSNKLDHKYSEQLTSVYSRSEVKRKWRIFTISDLFTGWISAINTPILLSWAHVKQPQAICMTSRAALDPPEHLCGWNFSRCWRTMTTLLDALLFDITWSFSVGGIMLWKGHYGVNIFGSGGFMKNTYLEMYIVHCGLQ